MKPSLPSRFTIRVYGVLINERHEILLSDEHILGGDYTKLPGGGLEFGEGTVEAVKREFMEEVGVKVEVMQHLYTTDFYVRSHFSSKVQVLSIYYLVGLVDDLVIPTSTKKYDFQKREHGAQSFRWVSLHELQPEELSFETDRVMLHLVRSLFNV